MGWVLCMASPRWESITFIRCALRSICEETGTFYTAGTGAGHPHELGVAGIVARACNRAFMVNEPMGRTPCAPVQFIYPTISLKLKM
jgi:hypothetical protein